MYFWKSRIRKMNQLRFYFSFLLLLFGLSFLSCSKISKDVFEGTVKDNASTKNLANVKVLLVWHGCDNCSNVEEETRTDSQGKFRMKYRLNVSTNYYLDFSLSGYESNRVFFNSGDNLDQYRNCTIGLTKK